MAKNYYYVLVLGTQDGRPKYVTKLENGKMCRWENDGTPHIFNRDMADSVSIGLCWNGTMAHTIVTTYEITQQLRYFEEE